MKKQEIELFLGGINLGELVSGSSKINDKLEAFDTVLTHQKKAKTKDLETRNEANEELQIDQLIQEL